MGRKNCLMIDFHLHFNEWWHGLRERQRKWEIKKRHCVFSHNSLLPPMTPQKRKTEEVVNRGRMRGYEQKIRISSTFILHFSGFSGVNIFNERCLRSLSQKNLSALFLPFMLGNSSIAWKTYKHGTYFSSDDVDDQEEEEKINDIVKPDQWLTLMQCSLCAKYCSKHFTNTSSFNQPFNNVTS